jgi:hypothetical protein
MLDRSDSRSDSDATAIRDFILLALVSLTVSTALAAHANFGRRYAGVLTVLGAVDLVASLRWWQGRTWPGVVILSIEL